ncbi:hypothetical protein ACWGQ5_41430 [Streptomyces sp. NPDC055722]
MDVDTVVLEVAIFSPVVSDAAAETARQAVREIRAELEALPAVRGPVKRVPDPSVPGRQGGELLVAALEIAAPALDIALRVIDARRTSRSVPNGSAPLEAMVRTTGPDGTREVVLKGMADDVTHALRALQAADPESPDSSRVS